MNFEHIHADPPQETLPRERQKQLEHKKLMGAHKRALEAFHASNEARETRQAQAFIVHVTCMDERNTFAAEAAGEPLGAAELFASPGGRITPKKLLQLYGDQIKEAKRSGKEIVIHLMPHKCEHRESGCAAFGCDEGRQRAGFSDLVDKLEKIPELKNATIIAEFYETNRHHVTPIAGDPPLKESRGAVKALQSMGQAGAETRGEWSQEHSGNRIYVGDLYRAWAIDRNTAYNLHSGMDETDLIDGIALAIKVIKGHSQVNTNAVPIVIHIDRHIGRKSTLSYKPNELIDRLKQSPNLKGIPLSEEEVEIISTETDPTTWKGREIIPEEIREAA